MKLRLNPAAVASTVSLIVAVILANLADLDRDVHLVLGVLLVFGLALTAITVRHEAGQAQ